MKMVLEEEQVKVGYRLCGDSGYGEEELLGSLILISFGIYEKTLISTGKAINPYPF